MSPAARRLVISVLAGLGALLSPLRGADAPVRSAPSRPGATPPATKAAEAPAPKAPRPASPTPSPATAAATSQKVGRIEYVAAAEVARALSLKLTWIERGRKLTLTGPSVAAELEADTRDITVNGLRVFLGDPVTVVNGQLQVSRVDFERCLTPMLRPGQGVAAPSAPKVIVLDAGHGGTDPGRVNAQLKINEKTYTLDVARRTKKLLEAAGFRVVMTRESDTFVALPQRAMLSNLARADVFVSIHFNAIPNDNKTSGVEVYTFAPRFQRSTNAWGPAEKNDIENHASPGNRFDHWNVALAHAIHRRFVFDLKAADRGKKLMHLAVLRPLQCPGVLVECGFLTSDAEARKIATPEYRQQIAVALAAGLRDYAAVLHGLKSRPPAAVPPAR